MGQINKYIEKLGFSNKSEPFDFGEFFSYFPKISNNNFKITYIFYKDEISLFNYHLSEWNKNELDFFIAVGKDRSYIIKAKEKANNDNILRSNVVIRSFDYGINTAGYENIVSSDIPFTKEKIDNSVFFNFVLEKQEKIKNEIDTHLLNNLIALKSEMSEFDKNNENINGLILKSLFIKYLEDRNILSNTSLVDAVKNKNSVKELKKTFNDISIINGDILKKNLSVTKEHTKELEIFFTEDYKEYKKSGSRYISGLFPYKFDKIPIQLISNIYEEFLGKTEKKTKGIFYTRTFVVDFMLSHTIYPKIQKYPNSTILDPACGSGAFLVQTFKKILNTQQEKKLSIDDKANILKKQIFGVDIDANALQITAFSLYLTLLDGINKDEIQEQIKKQTPILPSLIGSNLLQKNAITDEIKFIIEIDESNEKKNYTFSKFDCIVTNPPWKELKKADEKDDEIKKSREKIKNLSIYKNVNKYQTSQAFLLKINTLCYDNTDIAIITNNSNLLNEGAENFRTEILEKYRLKYFYELSDVADILFKGSKHPSAVLILDKQKIEDHKIKYITPRLTDFSRKLRLIAYSSKDIKEVKQIDLKDEDILWKIFVKGNWKDYQLIKKIEFKKDEELKVIFCGRGINPNKATPKEGKPIIIKMIDASQLDRFHIKKFDDFNINQNFERERTDKENLFKGSRILLKRTPSQKDELKLSSVFVENERYFKEQIIALKLNNSQFHKPYSAILNSSLIGFYFNQTSAQTNKGKKMSAIRHKELKELPLFKIADKSIKKLIDLYNIIQSTKRKNSETYTIEKELDELVFDLYGLLEFEKDIIREFYQINVERKNNKVKPTDIQTYTDKFREVYQLMIKNNLRINASFVKSKNLGTIVKFDIVNEKSFTPEVKQGGFEQRKVLQLVKDYHIQQEMLNGYINEEKVKIYDGKSFYIIKSNQFKDWTKRQATEDANDETKEMMKKMF